MDINSGDIARTTVFTVGLTLSIALCLTTIYTNIDSNYNTYLVEDRPECLFTPNKSQPYQTQEKTWCTDQIDTCAKANDCTIRSKEQNGFHIYQLEQGGDHWNFKLNKLHIPQRPLREGEHRV